MSDLQGFGPITFNPPAPKQQKDPDHHFNPAQFGKMLNVGKSFGAGAGAEGAGLAAIGGEAAGLAELAPLLLL